MRGRRGRVRGTRPAREHEGVAPIFLIVSLFWVVSETILAKHGQCAPFEHDFFRGQQSLHAASVHFLRDFADFGRPQRSRPRPGAPSRQFPKENRPLWTALADPATYTGQTPLIFCGKSLTLDGSWGSAPEFCSNRSNLQAKLLIWDGICGPGQDQGSQNVNFPKKIAHLGRISRIRPRTRVRFPSFSEESRSFWADPGDLLPHSAQNGQICK